MKGFNFIVAFAFSLLISLNTSAQGTQTDTKTKTEQTTSKSTNSEKKPADSRTKTGDKINHSLKGLKGETVYTGPKGGNYYLDKKENKVYLKN